MSGLLVVLVLVVWAISSRNDTMGGYFGRRNARTPEEKASALVQYMRNAGISLQQITEAWDRVPLTAVKEKRDMGKIVAKTLFFLGTIFVFAGICIYIGSFWNEMSSFLRVLMTLGSGLALFVYALIMVREGKLEHAFCPLICIAVLFEAGGWLVLQHEIFPPSGDVRKALLVCFTIMAVQQWGLYSRMPRSWLGVMAIGFTYAALDVALDLAGIKQEHIALLLGGGLFFTAYAVSEKSYGAFIDLFYVLAAGWFGAGLFMTLEPLSSYSFAVLVTGISWFALAYALKLQDREGIALFGFFAGSLTLCSGIFLMVDDYTSTSTAAMVTGLCGCSIGFGFQKEKAYINLSPLAFFIGSALLYVGLFDELRQTPLELLYFGLAVAGMYGSAIIQSRALLATSVCAMLGFIGYYTSEYFMRSASWPIALMIMGIAFLGVGSMAIRVKRKYNM